MLAYDGIVQRMRHRGAVVAVLDRDAIWDMCHIRKVVETAAVDAYAETPDAPLDGLAAALNDLAGAIQADDWHRIPQADVMFHRAFVALHDSPRAMAVYDQLISEIRLAALMSGHRDVAAGGSLIEEHRCNYDLPAGGKFEECRDEIGRIIDETRQRLIDGYSS